MKISHQFIIILSIISLVLPSFVSGQPNGNLGKQFPKPPETLEDFQGLLVSIIKPFQEGVLKVWRKTLATLQKMVDFLKNIWNLEVKPSFQNIWEKIFTLFEK